jgi:hypothetical protein
MLTHDVLSEIRKGFTEDWSDPSYLAGLDGDVFVSYNLQTLVKIR